VRECFHVFAFLSFDAAPTHAGQSALQLAEGEAVAHKISAACGETDQAKDGGHNEAQNLSPCDIAASSAWMLYITNIYGSIPDCLYASQDLRPGALSTSIDVTTVPGMGPSDIPAAAIDCELHTQASTLFVRHLKIAD
jgi:hypothetical protein